MSYQLFQLPKVIALDTAANVLPGAKLEFFETLTSDHQDTFQDAALATPHANPVVADSAGVFPAIYLAPLLRYKVTYTTAADVLIYTIDPANDQVLSQAVIGGFLYPRTAAELADGLTPTNYSVPSHEATGGYVMPSRYFDNAIPGTTDCTSILNTLADFCRAAGLALRLESETWLFSSSLDFSGITVQGDGRMSGIHLQCSSAQVDCITSEGSTCLRDFYIHGGWDGSTAGQSGDLLHFVSPTATAYNIHLDNLAVINAKENLIYWEDAGYSSISRCACLAAGLHGLVLAGAINTTVQVDGSTQFGATPNGRGVKITNGANITFNDVIIEDSAGIEILGSSNRSISFNAVYQENFTVASTNYLDASAAAGIGLTVSNSYGGGKVIQPASAWHQVYFFGNSNLGEPAIPFAGRVVQSDSGEDTVSTTGGLDFTAGTLSLDAGTWQITSTLQMLTPGGGVMVRAGIRITTNSGDSGLNISTNTGFREGCDEATAFGATNQDARLRAYTIFQLATATTVYLRGYLNFSAGTMAYHAFTTAVRL